MYDLRQPRYIGEPVVEAYNQANETLHQAEISRNTMIAHDSIFLQDFSIVPFGYIQGHILHRSRRGHYRTVSSSAVPLHKIVSYQQPRLMSLSSTQSLIILETSNEIFKHLDSAFP
jgi:hypothetical protein